MQQINEDYGKEGDSDVDVRFFEDDTSRKHIAQHHSLDVTTNIIEMRICCQ